MKIISLGSFMNDAKAFKRFVLRYDDPLSPFNFKAEFDHIAVCLSAYPYISIRNHNGSLCIHHINTIKKCCHANKNTEYVLICDNYFSDDEKYQTNINIEILQ